MISAAVLFILLTTIRSGTAGYSINGRGTGPQTKYRVEGVVSEGFLSPADASGKHSGFIIELLDAMKSISNGTFDYVFTVQAKNSNGDSINGTNTGLIKDIVDNVCDIGAADMTARSSRHQAVDFLQPFVRTQGRIAVNNPLGRLGSNPIFYILPKPSLNNFFAVTSNVTLKNIFNTAKAANRTVASSAEGISKLLASNVSAAFIDETPGLSLDLQSHSDQLSLTSDVLYTGNYAFAVQQNRNDLRVMLNILLLKVQERGQLQTLLTKYHIDF